MTPEHETGGRRGSELWSLREDVRMHVEPGGLLIRLESPWGEVTIQRPSRIVAEALRRMVLGPISLENVIDASDGHRELQDAAEALAALREVLGRFQPLVIRTLGFDSGQPLLSVVPVAPRSRFAPAPLPEDLRVRLSAFAQLRTDGSEYRLESPLAVHRVLLHRPEAVWLLSSLGRPVPVAAVLGAAQSAQAWPHGARLAAEALAYLAAVGMLVTAQGPEPARGAGTAAGAEPAAHAPELQDFAEHGSLAGWSATELTFHTRSNSGRHDRPVGRSYPLGAEGSPEPVVKPRRAGAAIPLSRPSWDRLVTADPPLAVVMERRRSTRGYGVKPVTAEELGELLYRTARIRRVLTPHTAPADPAAGRELRLSDRPYPGGGACYELELYLTVDRCHGIPRGIYHYDPLGHGLELVNNDQRTAGLLLRHAADNAAMDAVPPVLITMTARFRRLAWKYEGIAYATVLKDLGVLLQSLYLVCTAMGLAPCALGAVNLELTAQAFGTDWLLEPSVGQFMLGRAPDVLPEHGWQAEPVNDPQWIDLARELLRDQ